MFVAVCVCVCVCVCEWVVGGAREGGGRGAERPYPSNLLNGLGIAYHLSVSCHAPPSLNIQYPTPISVTEVHAHRVGQS